MCWRTTSCGYSNSGRLISSFGRSSAARYVARPADESGTLGLSGFSRAAATRPSLRTIPVRAWERICSSRDSTLTLGTSAAFTSNTGRVAEPARKLPSVQLAACTSRKWSRTIQRTSCPRRQTSSNSW